MSNDDLKLLSNLKINTKKSKKNKTPISEQYKVFLKKGVSNIQKKEKTHKKINILKVDNKNKENKFIDINKIKDTNKSKNKFTKKSQVKNKRRPKRNKNYSKIKKLSFKCTKTNDLNNIIKKTNKKTNNELKTELKGRGIDIKSNNKKLLKDIYLFTSCGDILINKE